ncbi:hypothetical protein [Lentzea sp. CA-135723]|uniref:hypothetical protein n=1 Tax=Lentzea sp. CA-135723 TaxID=3239950 RepID=UPI003D8D4699
MFSRIASVAGAAAIVGGAMLGVTSPANAETVPGCGSLPPIGTTAYVMSGGTKIGSVKQFAGCGKNYAYTYVWEGFRSTHDNWEVCVSVATGSSAPYTLEGLKCISNKADNWSSGTSTLSQCTHAVGNVKWGSNHPTARTSIRC